MAHFLVIFHSVKLIKALDLLAGLLYPVHVYFDKLLNPWFGKPISRAGFKNSKVTGKMGTNRLKVYLQGKKQFPVGKDTIEKSLSVSGKAFSMNLPAGRQVCLSRSIAGAATGIYHELVEWILSLPNGFRPSDLEGCSIPKYFGTMRGLTSLFNNGFKRKKPLRFRKGFFNEYGSYLLSRIFVQYHRP